MKQYIAAHRSDYNLEEVQDLIEATNIIRHYSPQTYWEPGEDAVEFDVEYDKKFSEIVKVIEFDFFGDEENPFAVIVDGWTYCFNEQAGWENLLKSLGWVFFENELGEAYENDKETVEDKIDEWAYKVAEDKAWEYIDNLKYGDY